MKRVLPFFVLLFFLSCSRDKGPLPAIKVDCNTVTFSNTINPIIAARCATPNCHVSGFGMGDLSTYAGVKAKVDNNSFRFRVIESKLMPIGPPLSNTELQQIECWLEAQAPNN